METPALSRTRGWLLTSSLMLTMPLVGAGCAEPDAALYRLLNYERIETDPRLGPISVELVEPVNIPAIREQIGAPSGISYQPDLGQLNHRDVSQKRYSR